MKKIKGPNVLVPSEDEGGVEEAVGEHAGGGERLGNEDGGRAPLLGQDEDEAGARGHGDPADDVGQEDDLEGRLASKASPSSTRMSIREGHLEALDGGQSRDLRHPPGRRHRRQPHDGAHHEQLRPQEAPLHEGLPRRRPGPMTQVQVSVQRARRAGRAECSRSPRCSTGRVAEG